MRLNSTGTLTKEYDNTIVSYSTPIYTDRCEVIIPHCDFHLDFSFL